MTEQVLPESSFDQKFANRTHTMYLSKIDKQPRKHSRQVRDPLRTDDIDGARSRYLDKQNISIYNQPNRQSFILKTDDLLGSKPKNLYPTYVREDKSLNSRDIQGAAPRVNKFQSSRNTNPLCPVYQLSKVEYIPPEEPKFIRDNINIYDIEGSSTKETFSMRLQREGRLIKKEPIITHTKSNLVPKTNNFMMDVTDINKGDSKKPAERNTNPLQPKYTVRDENNNIAVIGDITKNKPKQLIKTMNKPDYLYSVKDIAGTAIGSVRNKNLDTQYKDVKPEKVTNNVQDIPGAVAGSRKPGLVSKRVGNPLQPQYVLPGHTEPPVVKTTMNSRPRSAVQRFDSFIS